MPQFKRGDLESKIYYHQMCGPYLDPNTKQNLVIKKHFLDNQKNIKRQTQMIKNY